jgi:Uma2 family endonuclease
MTLSASPGTLDAATPHHALSPLRFPSDMRLTPVQFALLCAENRESVLELAVDGQALAMTPTGSETGARNSRLEMRLLLWADQQGG